MPHLHLGLLFVISVYLSWAIAHTLVQMVGIQLHNTRFGQVLTTFG